MPTSGVEQQVADLARARHVGEFVVTVWCACASISRSFLSVKGLFHRVLLAYIPVCVCVRACVRVSLSLSLSLGMDTGAPRRS